MVHISTISRVAFEGIGELMIITAAVLASLSFNDGAITFMRVLLIIILVYLELHFAYLQQNFLEIF